MPNGTNNDNNGSRNVLYRIVEGGAMMLLIAVGGLLAIIALFLCTGNIESLMDLSSEPLLFTSSVCRSL